MFGKVNKYAMLDASFTSEVYFSNQGACPCVADPSTDVCTASTLTNTTVFPEYGLNVTTLTEGQWVDVRIGCVLNTYENTYFKFHLPYEASRPCPILSVEMEAIMGYPTVSLTVNRGIATVANAQWIKSTGNYPSLWICGQHPEFEYGTYYFTVLTYQPSPFTSFRARFKIYGAPECPAPVPPPFPDDGSFLWVSDGDNVNGMVQVGEYQYYKAYVPQPCSNLTVAVYRTGGSGDIDIYVSTTIEQPGYAYISKWLENGFEWKSNTDNDDHVAVSFCNATGGSELLLHIGVTTVSASDTTFMLIFSTALIVPPRAIQTLEAAQFVQTLSTGWFSLTCGEEDTPEEILCDWYQYDSCQYDEYNCCWRLWPVAPTRTPQPFLPWNIAFPDEDQMQIPWPDRPAQLRRHFPLALWLSTSTPDSTQAFVINATDAFLQTCSLQLRAQFIGRNGEALDLPAMKLTPRTKQCYEPDFKQFAQTTRARIEEMNSLTDAALLRATHLRQTLAAFDGTLKACYQASLQIPRAETATNSWELSGVISCSLTPFDPRFGSDPCCNSTLFSTECCIPKTAEVSISAQPAEDLSNDQAFSACSSSNCARVRYQDLAATMKDVYDQSSGCSATYLRTSGAEIQKQLSSFVDTCRDTILGPTLHGISCGDDSECLTSCNKLTGKCAHNESLVLQCFAEKIDPMVARLLMNEWGVTGRFSSAALIQAFSDNILTSQCTGIDSIEYRRHFEFAPILAGCEDSCTPVQPLGFVTTDVPEICNEQQFLPTGCYREWSVIDPALPRCAAEANECNWMNCKDLGLSGAACQAACEDVGLSTEVCVTCLDDSSRCSALDSFNETRCSQGLCVGFENVTDLAQCGDFGSCDSPVCPGCAKSTCESTGFCSDRSELEALMAVHNYTGTEGVCLSDFLFNQNFGPFCEEDDLFSTYGCFEADFNSSADCEDAGCLWYPLVLAGQSEQERCEASPSTCFDPTYSVFRARATAADCAACAATSGGQMKPRAEWLFGQFTPARTAETTWVTRTYAPVRSLGQSIDYLGFKAQLDQQIGVLFSYAFVTDALCQYDRTNTLVSSLICDCGFGESSGCYNTNLTSTQIGATLFCAYSASQIDLPDMSLLASDETYTDNDCHSVRVHQTLATQFKRSSVSRSLSSAIFQTDPSKNEFSIVKNDKGTVVGQLVSNGIEIVADPFSNPAQLCITTESVIVQNEAFTVFNLAILFMENYTVTAAPYIASNVTATEKSVCGTVRATGTYFAVKLLAEWETTSSSEASTQRNFGIAGAVLYFFVGLFALFQMVMILLSPDWTRENRTVATKDKIRLLVFVLLFQIIRGVYLAIEPEVWDLQPIGNYIVFEIPTFMFFTIYTGIIYLWVAVVVTYAHMGRRSSVQRFRVAYVLFNGAMFLVFAAFTLIFSLSPTTSSSDEQCNLGALAVTPSLSESQRSVSLAYNSIIAIICLGLSISFLVTLILLLKPIIRSAKLNKRRTNDDRSIFNMAVISVLGVVCTVCFLVRSAVFLYSVITGNSVPVLLFVFLEIVPIIGLVYYNRPFKGNPFAGTMLWAGSSKNRSSSKRFTSDLSIQ